MSIKVKICRESARNTTNFSVNIQQKNLKCFSNNIMLIYFFNIGQNFIIPSVQHNPLLLTQDCVLLYWDSKINFVKTTDKRCNHSDNFESTHLKCKIMAK